MSLCLTLWDYDHSLFHALDLAKGFLIPLDALNVLWPCPGESVFISGKLEMKLKYVPGLTVQRATCEELRRRLTQACATARVQAPLPPHISLPPKLQAILQVL